MKYRLFGILVPGGVALVAAALLVYWLRTGPTEGLDLRVPGMEGAGLDPGLRPGAGDVSTPTAGEPTRFDGKPSDLPGTWPCFRGPNRDGICDDGVRLARNWPQGGPEVLWRLDLLGRGHAGAAISGGKSVWSSG